MLERCGCEFFRVRESAFYSSKVAAMEQLWRALEERAIRPGPSLASMFHEMEEEECDEFNCNVTEGDDDLNDDEQSVLHDLADDLGQSRRRAEEISKEEIQDAIVRALTKCPNRSCTLHSLTSRVLKEVGVVTRGKPREEFARRVMRSLNTLEKREKIEKYKAKNRRVRLLLAQEITERSTSYCRGR
jgi:hypothetical protein